jgi:hypothetical protein
LEKRVETVNKTLIGKVYVENTSPEAKEKSKPIG